MVIGGCARSGAGIGLCLLAACTASSPGAPQATKLAADTDCREVAAIAAGAKAIPVGPDGRPLLAVLTAPTARSAVRAPCILAVGTDAAAMTTSVVVAGRRSVESSYADPDGRRINPAYRAAKEALAERERQADIDSAGSEDMLTQAAGAVWDGATYLFRPSDAQLRAKLRATPRYLDEGEPVTYALAIEDVDGSKSAKVELALIDRRTGQAVLRSMPLAESRRFAIADDLAPTDQSRRDGDPGYVERAALDRWLEAPPLPSLDVALRPFARPSADETILPGGLPAVMARWEGVRSPERPGVLAAAPVPMPPGVVRIEGMAGDGQGFYAAADKIVTASDLIGDTSLVKVTDEGGTSTYGVVDRRDDGAGLAMVYVQLPGRPLTLGDGRRPTPAYLRRGEAVSGHPLLSAAGAVTGMVTDAKAHRTVDAPALRAFMHRAGGLDAPAAASAAASSPAP